MLQALTPLRLVIGLVPMIGGAMWFGMPSDGVHYDQSPQEVKAAIAAAYLPTHVLGSYIKGSKVSTPDDHTVVTSLLGENDAELMRFVTTVTPDGAGSEVDTVVEAPQGQYAERAQEAMKKNGYAMVLMEKLADEHIAAAIEHRPFDMLAFNPMAKGLAKAAGYDQTFAQANVNMAEMDKASQDDWKSSVDYSEDSDVRPLDPTPVADEGEGWAE
jgi:hypothetical protein